MGSYRKAGNPLGILGRLKGKLAGRVDVVWSVILVEQSKCS